MDLSIKYDITLDLIRNNYVAIRTKQYDVKTRKLVVHCTTNGQELKLDKDIQALIQVKKPDGYNIGNPCTIDVENNVVVADITKQMSSVIGVSYADIILYNVTTGQTLGTMKFNIVTDSSILRKEDFISSDEFESLAELVVCGKQKIQELIELMKKVEQKQQEYAAAESQRQKNEQTRQSQEQQRQSYESIRAQAESARKSAESGRVSAESERVSAENLRVLAEASRVNVENNRVNAESGRVDAEKSRVLAETSRSDAEKVRQSNETKRLSSESSRVKAEEGRYSAENTRNSNENARELEENKRIEAEKLRASTESTRSSAETQRGKDEVARKNAESARASAELSRASAENERNSAEDGRVSAESKRVSAESARVGAESKRQTDTASAIKGCTDIKSIIENKLHNGEFDGKTILSGGGVPSAGIGKNGDVYIETQGVGQYPYHFFIKESAEWKPKWAMRGLNGQVVNSLDNNSLTNAPSVRAVKDAIFKIVVDSLIDNSTTNAPSVRVVKEQLDNKANKIVLMNSTASEIIKPIELAFKTIQDSGSTKIIQIIDKTTKDSMFPEVRWEHVIGKNVIEQEVNTIKDKLKKCIFFK